MTNLSNRLPAWLLPAIGLLPCAALAAPSYTLTDLGTFGGPSSSAYGINASGTIVGESTGLLTTDTNGDAVGFSANHAFTYSGGVMTDIGNLYGDDSHIRGYGINSLGEVVGQTDLGAGNGNHAFSNSGGTLTDLGTLGGNFSVARGINSAGTAVGDSKISNGSSTVRAFSYSGGVMTSLGTLPGNTSSSAYGINDAGTIIGWSGSSASSHHGFSYSSGVMTDLGTFGGVFSEALAINAAGTIVGRAQYGVGSGIGLAIHAFSYSGGVMTDLGSLITSGDSSALGINGIGTVVGWTEVPGTSARHAFVSVGGFMTDLNTAVSDSPGWLLSQATGVNDDGLIVGFGTNPSGETHGFLLTPAPAAVPEPGESAAAAGLALVAYGAWRRRHTH